MPQEDLPQPVPSGNLALDRWIFLLWKKLTSASSILWSQIVLPTEAANTFLGGPASGSDAQVTFRPLVTADLPTVDISHGGTGQATKTSAFDALAPTTTQGDIIYYDGTDNVRLAKGTAGQLLAMNAGATAPEWKTDTGTGTVTSIDVSGGTTGFSFTGGPITTSGTITLSGTLDADNGGTGFYSYAVGDILYASTTSALSKLADVGSGSYLRSGGVNAAPLWSTLKLPNSATVHRIPYATSTDIWADSANLTFDGTTLATTGLNNTGSTTLGDTSSDSLTINAATWTLGSAFSAIRAIGAAPAGSYTGQAWTTTLSGNAGGTTDLTAISPNVTFSGSNSATRLTGITNSLTVSATAGTLGTANGFASGIILNNAGNVTTARSLFVYSPTLSSTGAITNLFGLQVSDLGHATLVTNAVLGVDVANFTAGPNLSAAYRGQNSSGTGKWNAYMSGTANNAFAGAISVKKTTVPNYDMDINGTLAISQGQIVPGTYTPTLTNVANLDASTAYACQYIRVGNNVTVSGKVDIDPTLVATSTQLGISLPIATNLSAAEQCAGTASAVAIAGQCAAIIGDATNDRAQMQWISGDVTNQAMYFTFTYRVI